MFFDDWKIDFNIKCLKSITIFWCYVLWTRCRFKYYVKKSKTLKIDFKRFKHFNQNTFDFESINNKTFFRRMRVRRVRTCENYISKISNTIIIYNVFRKKNWKKLNMNYWTNDRIRIDLKINEKTYKIIYVFLKKKLIKNEMLNDKFNHVNIKKKLQSIFITIKNQYFTIFDNVDST